MTLLLRPERVSPGTRTGRLGELLTTYALESAGVQVSRVDREEIDLWARTPTGRMKTLQVKTCSEPLRDRDRPLRYRFSIEHGTTADLYALVALDRERVLIYPAHSPAGLGHLKPEIFTTEAQRASIEEFLA
jgi:hypothetical protein